MKVLRSTLIVGAAVFAAACGDKVTVPPATTSNPAVHSVTVAPSTASLTVGGTLNMTAAVTADAGATYTVAWTTSDASKVSVNATSGAITAVAVTPGVAICASAGGAQGCATIVVTAVSTVPATVSIASITFGNLNTPIPVPPGFVAGQIDVKLNVTANSVALDSVVVYVDGASTAKQTFTAAQAAALRSIASDAVAEQVGAVTIVISINTADCKVGTNLQAPCNFTNNTVSWLNSSTNGGNNHQITAKSFGHFAGTSTQTSSPSGQSVPVAFGNVSGWFAKVSLTPNATQVASSVDAVGYQWKSGGMSVQAVPLIYYLKTDGVTPESVLSANVTYNNFGCDPGPIRTAVMTAPTAPSIIWTGTFTNISAGQTGAGAVTNVGTYEMNPAINGTCGGFLTTGGETIQMNGIGSDNNNLFFTAGGVFAFNTTSNFTANPDITFRLDNFGPTGVAGTLTPGGRTNNWENDAVVLNGFNTAAAPALVPAASTTPNGVVTAGADLGSGRLVGTSTPVVFTARTGLATDASSSVDASAAVTSTAALAESQPLMYRLRLRGTDPLGNSNNVSVGTFGVDRTAPTLAFAGGTANNARLAVYSVGSYLFSATDATITVGAQPSAFLNLAAAPLQVSQMRRNVTPGSVFFCPTGAATGSFLASGATCASWASGTTNFAANLVVSELNGLAVVPTLDAYYTISATVTDQAGNVSPAAVRVQLDDATAAAIGVLVPTGFAAGGPALFGGSVADNLDLQLERLNVVNAGMNAALTDQVTAAAWGGATTAAGGSTLWFPDQIINSYNATPLIPSAPFAVTVSNFITNLQATTGAGGLNPSAVGATVPTGANGFVLNQANTVTASAAVILAPTLPVAAAISNGSGAAGNGPVVAGVCPTLPLVPTAYVQGPWNFVMTNTAGTSLLSLTGAGGLATSVTLNAQAQGCTSSGPVSGNFANPFSAVQFWAYDPTAGATEGWRLIATVNNASSVSDGGSPTIATGGRWWTFTTVWTPGASTAPDTGPTVYRVVAIGIAGTNMPAAQQGMALATPISLRLVSVAP